MTLQGVPVIQRTARPVIAGGAWEPEEVAASTTHDLLQTILLPGHKLLLTHINDGGAVPTSVVLDPDGLDLPLQPIPRIAELGNLRITGWFLDNAPAGLNWPIRITTPTAVWHTAHSWVVQDGRIGEPEAVVAVSIGNSVSTFLSAVIEDEESLLLGDAFSISTTTVAAVLSSGMLTKTNPGMTDGESAIVNSAYLAAYGDYTHNNNGDVFLGWTAPSEVPMVQLVINVLFAGEPVVTPPAETEIIAHWKLDELGTTFVDQIGNSDMVVVAGSVQPNDPLLADGGKSQKFLSASVRAPNHETWRVPTAWNTFFTQQTAVPGVNTHRTIANMANKPDSTAKVPGEWSIEPRNDGGTQRLRYWARDTNGQAQFAGALSSGVGSFSTDVGHRIDTFHDGTRWHLYLDAVWLGQTVPVPCTQDVTAFMELGAYGVTTAFFAGLIDEVILRKGCPVDKEAAIAGEPAAVTVTPPVEPSPVVMSPVFLGVLTAGQTATRDPRLFGTGFIDGSNIELVEVSDAANRLSVDNNQTATAALRYTMPGSLPSGLASKTAVYQVRQDGGPLSNQWEISWQEQGATSGGFQFKTTFPPVSHAGVQSRPPFNAMDPRSASRVDPMSDIEFWRVFPSKGDPVFLRGNVATGLVAPSVMKSENAPSCFRGFNADGSALLLCESKSIPGDASNSCRFAVVDCTGEHGATQPYQIIRATGQPYGGDGISGPGCFWDALDRYSIYAVLQGTSQGAPQGMWRWWPFGRPAGPAVPHPGFERGGQARAVGAKVKLFDLPAGFGEMHFPRGGRARPSVDGRWYFLPCRRNSDGKWGGIRLDLFTGETGPFVLNPDQPTDNNDRAIAKTSALGVIGVFSYQNLSHFPPSSLIHNTPTTSHPAGGHDTRNARFVNMQTGAILAGANSIIGGHGDFFDLGGQEFLIGLGGGNQAGWYIVDPATATFERKILDTLQLEVEHNNNNNFFDRFEIYGAAGGSTHGHRYTICSVTVPYVQGGAGIYGVRLGVNDFNVMRYLINPRSKWTIPKSEGGNGVKNNFAEVHPHIAPRPNSLGNFLLYFNSNWMIPGIETNINHVNPYIALIPPAWFSPNNSGT